MTPQSHQMSPREWTMLLMLALVWAGSFFFVAVAVQEVPPLTVVAVRVTGAAVLLWAYLALRGVRFPKGWRVWLAFFGMGFLNNAVPFSLIFWAQTEIASGLAAILNAMTPVFTVLVAHVLTGDEKMSSGRLAGVLLGFAGVAVLIGGVEAGGSLLAHLAVLGAAFSYALASVFGKGFVRMGVAPVTTAAGQVTASACLMIPVALILDCPCEMGRPSGSSIAALAGLAAVSTALAYVLYFRLLATAGATNLMLVTLLIPPGAVLLGALLLGEVLTTGHVAGMGLIALGLVAIDGRAAAKMLALRPRK